MGSRYGLGSGIVIRRQALPSGDVVVTLLSGEGKWRGVARKGRLPGGNVGRLSLFHDVTVQYYRRREDDLALLTQVRLNGALPRLSTPQVYPYANVLAELADALTADLAGFEPLYEYLASGLRGLDRFADPERVCLLYSWRMLQQAGLAPRVNLCPRCSRQESLTMFDVPAGSLTCNSCRGTLELGEEVAGAIQMMVSGGMRQALAAELGERPRHWLALSLYLSYHVTELRSLRGIAPPVLSASPNRESEEVHT